jgi:hypothetical protein
MKKKVDGYEQYASTVIHGSSRSAQRSRRTSGPLLVEGNEADDSAVELDRRY